ncbi:hypothetical protein Ppa06_21120 [Planomonospora parontospora subsp. parontospora]|uniref:Uncharacterized protein n=2 Tax=Planomonospora parontospora TaxID=58119 RepID=A0AA37F3Z1_9ACTN|nr:hypothetical protein GCM10010126_22430 [Planomonospora parontospora]GII08314.1 hypothetical protein Ppa06_21120 [Planomonospora parontospora subsp. parontospora]
MDVNDLAAEPKRGRAERSVGLASGGLARQLVVGIARYRSHSDRTSSADKCASECARYSDDSSDDRYDAAIHIGPNVWRRSDI